MEPESDSGDGSDTSSASASGFIVAPSIKVSKNNSRRSEKNRAIVSNKVFSDEDEMALLQGLSVFWGNGKNNKWAEFHEFIKDELPHSYTKIQISEKIRALKKKFLNGKFDSPDPHQSVMFELSKKLWEDEVVTSKVEEKGKAKKRAETEPHEEGKMKKKKKKKQTYEEEKQIREEEQHIVVVVENKFESNFPMVWASLSVFQRGVVHRIGSEKARELEEKWRQVRAEELRLKVKNMELLITDYKQRSGENV